MKVKYTGKGNGIFLHNIDFKPGVEHEVPDELVFESSVFEVSKKVEAPEVSKSTDSSSKPKSQKKSK